MSSYMQREDTKPSIVNINSQAHRITSYQSIHDSNGHSSLQFASRTLSRDPRLTADIDPKLILTTGDMRQTIDRSLEPLVIALNADESHEINHMIS